MIGKVTWEKVTSNSEWVYIGAANETNKQLVIDTISKQLSGDVLHFALSRPNSISVNKNEIDKILFDFLSGGSFLIWDTHFKKVVELNSIGTMRCGEITS
jgi:hypothetical protein